MWRCVPEGGDVKSTSNIPPANRESTVQAVLGYISDMYLWVAYAASFVQHSYRTWVGSLEAGKNALGLRRSNEEEADVAAFAVRPIRVIRVPGLTLATIDDHRSFYLVLLVSTS